MKERFKLAFILIIASILVSVLIGLFLALITPDGSGFDRFINLSKSIFFFFGAPGAVSGVLVLLTNIKDDLAIPFGLWIYYGSAAIAYFISNIIGWEMEDEALIVISGTISCLIAYIVWSNKYKEPQD